MHISISNSHLQCHRSIYTTVCNPSVIVYLVYLYTRPTQVDIDKVVTPYTIYLYLSQWHENKVGYELWLMTYTSNINDIIKLHFCVASDRRKVNWFVDIFSKFLLLVIEQNKYYLKMNSIYTIQLQAIFFFCVPSQKYQGKYNRQVYHTVKLTPDIF